MNENQENVKQKIQDLKFSIESGKKPLSKEIADLETQSQMNQEELQQLRDTSDRFLALLEGLQSNNTAAQGQLDELQKKGKEINVSFYYYNNYYFFLFWTFFL